MARNGLSDWNFWTPVLGTTYEFTPWHPDDMGLPVGMRRKIRGYGGKTIQRPWTKRVEDHMWARHHRNAQPKPWRDTVPGWRPDGTAQEIINAGGVHITFQAWTVPLVLTLVETFYSIKWRRPVYNDINNHGNRRRIPLSEQYAQAAIRNGQVPTGIVQFTNRPRFHVGTGAVLAPLALVALLGVGMLFWPGNPGWEAVVAVHDGIAWAAVNWRLFAGMALLGGASLVYAQGGTTTRRRRRRRRYR